MFSLQLKLFTLLSIVFHGALLGLLIYLAPKKVDVPPQPLKVGLVTLDKDPGVKKGSPGPPREKEPGPVKKAEPPKPKPEPVKKPEKKVVKKKPVKKAPQKEVITRAPVEEKPGEPASDAVNPSQAGDSDDEVAQSRPSSNAVAGSGGSGLGSSGAGKGSDSVGYPDYGINPKPKYPMIAKRYGYEGLVVLNVYVLENGRVGKIQLKKSSGYDVLDNSALKAVKGWVFVPGMRNGKPASSWVVVPVRFNLTSG